MKIIAAVAAFAPGDAVLGFRGVVADVTIDGPIATVVFSTGRRFVAKATWETIVVRAAA